MADIEGSFTAAGLVEKVSSLLSDQCEGNTYETWSKKDLTSYLNDALCQILALRPDAFACIEEIPLVTGTRQTLPDGYHSIVSIEEADDGSTSGASETTSDILKHYRKPSCVTGLSSDGTYTPSSFRRNDMVKTSFYVSPAVPEGANATITATVIKNPATQCADSTATLPLGCEYEAQIVDWMMMRALSVEAESSNVSLQLARDYRQGFYLAFNTNYRQAQRVGSGYYLGQEGDGDESFRSR